MSTEVQNATSSQHDAKLLLPAVPTWYTPDEMRHYLIRHNYSREIADELAQRWADDLQGAFKKGYEKGYAEGYSR
jgi:hypothetical protein